MSDRRESDPLPTTWQAVVLPMNYYRVLEKLPPRLLLLGFRAYQIAVSLLFAGSLRLELRVSLLESDGLPLTDNPILLILLFLFQNKTLQLVFVVYLGI